MVLRVLWILATVLSISACRGGSSSSGGGGSSYSTSSEVGQQIAEIALSIDESGGSTSGAIARKTPASPWLTLAHAATSCWDVAFSSCSAGSRTRNFGDCSIGVGSSISGTVTLTFAGTGSGSCTLPSTSDSVTRSPNFTITGPRGGTYSVSVPTGLGQTITRTGASTFNFTNSSIRRVVANAGGTNLIDVTTRTTSAIGISGNSRLGRTINSGTLEVTDNLTGTVCNVSPTSVTWGSASCNCPTSGNWSGTCTNGSSSSLTYSSTCGTATLTYGGSTQTITLDRCSS